MFINFATQIRPNLLKAEDTFSTITASLADKCVYKCAYVCVNIIKNE